MAERQRKGYNQKLKMLILARLFLNETDDGHGLTMPQIISRLEAEGVNADRKTLYNDFEELRRFGFDIIAEKDGRSCYYYLGSRRFEMPELKLLVDAVQASRFITDKKSKELIKKLESLTSRHRASLLQRQVMITGRIKMMNENIYYNVDTLHEAINAGRRITFRYVKWNLKKEAVPRRDGALYEVSPWALLWDDEKYYLIGYDAGPGEIRHYRVDKMLDISLTDQAREGRDSFRRFDVPSYANALFGMFGGENTRVTLEAENEMVGILIDRFGRDILIQPVDDSHFRTVIDAAVSRQFLAWIISLGPGIRITGPARVVEAMRREVCRLSAEYGEGTP